MYIKPKDRYTVVWVVKQQKQEQYLEEIQDLNRVIEFALLYYHFSTHPKIS